MKITLPLQVKGPMVPIHVLCGSSFYSILDDKNKLVCKVYAEGGDTEDALAQTVDLMKIITAGIEHGEPN